MKFSILVPVYNVEKFLEECIQSVLLQTYSNWELILVNDGSTDTSLKICEDYKSKDSRIKIVNQENKGLLQARRVAIPYATGDYICFLDSDDFWDVETLETVTNIIMNKEIDMVLINHKKVSMDGMIKVENKHIYDDGSKYRRLDKEKVLIDFLTSNKINNIWSKIIKSSIVKQDLNDYNKFGRLMQSEDRLQSIELLSKSKEIIYINNNFYNYRNNFDSISFNFGEKNFLDILETETFINNYLINSYKKNNYIELFHKYFISNMMATYLRINALNKLTKKEKKKLLNIINDSSVYKSIETKLSMKLKFFDYLIKRQKVLILDILSRINKIRIRRNIVGKK